MEPFIEKLLKYLVCQLQHLLQDIIKNLIPYVQYEELFQFFFKAMHGSLLAEEKNLVKFLELQNLNFYIIIAQNRKKQTYLMLKSTSYCSIFTIMKVLLLVEYLFTLNLQYRKFQFLPNIKTANQ